MKHVRTKCPYCGRYNNRVEIDIDFTGGKLVTTCDLEEGGCDKDYVVKIEVKIVATEFKIEGGN